jgi:hypothetical protein
MPVIGRIPMFIPTLTKTSNSSIATMPPATSAPKRFLAMVRMRSPRQMTRAYIDSTNAAPTNPQRSPTTANAKSVWCSGRKLSFVCVARSPRPVFSPEPMAMRDWFCW